MKHLKYESDLNHSTSCLQFQIPCKEALRKIELMNVELLNVKITYYSVYSVHARIYAWLPMNIYIYYIYRSFTMQSPLFTTIPFWPCLHTFGSVILLCYYYYYKYILLYSERVNMINMFAVLLLKFAVLIKRDFVVDSGKLMASLITYPHPEQYYAYINVIITDWTTQ